jgi:hypothetical protein
MPIFSDFARYFEAVPTVLRRKADNVIRMWVQVLTEGATASAQALSEYVDTSYPLQTASTWILDQHWGPFYNLQRNGMNDPDFRLYNLAQRRLNRSTGNVDGLLIMLRELLPLATSIAWVPYYPKEWEVTVAGVPLTQSGLVFEFLRKKPSPQGGGYSVAGDNGIGIAFDAVVMSFSSVHGATTVTGSWSSTHGASGSAEAGWAHAVPI